MRRRITLAKREQIEKEQRILDKTIVRPFDVVEGLPVSYAAPGNFEDVLKNPLSIKDSAVLYNALIRSRNTYVFHCPMFKLYWVKQTAYAKKLADLERERGPLSLEAKRRLARANGGSVEMKTRAPMLSADVNARDVMSKLCEAHLLIGPHRMEIRIFIAKDARSEKSKAFDEISKLSDYDLFSIGLVDELEKEAMTLPPLPPKPAPMAASAPAAALAPSKLDAAVPKPEATSEAKPQATPEAKSEAKVEEMPKPAPVAANENKPKEATASTTASGTSTPAPPPRPAPPSLPATSALANVENQVMISNLNAIARIEASLNDLMREVALGQASDEKITLFKRYIERAKQMGPQPHHVDLYISYGLPVPPHLPRPYNSKATYFAPRIQRPKYQHLLKLTAFQEKYLYNATLVFEFLENPNVRYVIPRDSICEVLDLDKAPKLLDDGTEVRDILVSHLWIHNPDEVEEFEKKFSEHRAELRRRAEERRDEQKREAEEKEEKEDPKKKKRPPPKKQRHPDRPREPQVRYTALSFTLHDVPDKFIPIVLNSMRPMKHVQNKMERILEHGTRVGSFHLWYQVDARLDEKVAERLRYLLNQEERKMQGVISQAAAEARKRKRELKTLKAKRHSPGYGLPVPVKHE